MNKIYYEKRLNELKEEKKENKRDSVLLFIIISILPISSFIFLLFKKIVLLPLFISIILYIFVIIFYFMKSKYIKDQEFIIKRNKENNKWINIL